MGCNILKDMRIGEKVVCADDIWDVSRFERFYFPNGLPVKGKTYVVRGIDRHNGIDALLLTGFPAILCETNSDWGFIASRFRSLSEVKSQNREVKEHERMLENRN